MNTLNSTDLTCTQSRSGTANLSVAFLLLPDFTLSTLSGFVDALRLAADTTDRSRQLHCRWTILGPSRAPVRSSCGIDVEPWELLQDARAYDYTVVVGGLVRGHVQMDRRILTFLRQIDRRGGSLVGVCTGSFALARAGLMHGHRCCVHWYHLKEFRSEFPTLRAEADTVYVVDGKRITCAGGQSAADVALYLIEKHCGRSISLKVTSALVLEAARGPMHPQPHPESRWFREIKSDLVQRAIVLMEQCLPGRRGVMRDVADKLGVSTRTLVRSFQRHLQMSPCDVLRAMRIARCRWELCNTRKAIRSIALDNGFFDASHFSRCFHQYVGITPAAARQLGPRHQPERLGKRTRRQGDDTVLQEIVGNQTLCFDAIDWPQEQMPPQRARTVR